MHPRHSFDELAKGLANGTVPRGQALRLIGGTLLGGVLASIPGGAALAQLAGPPDRPGRCAGVTCGPGKVCAIQQGRPQCVCAANFNECFVPGADLCCPPGQVCVEEGDGQVSCRPFCTTIICDEITGVPGSTCCEEPPLCCPPGVPCGG